MRLQDLRKSSIDQLHEMPIVANDPLVEYLTPRFWQQIEMKLQESINNQNWQEVVLAAFSIKILHPALLANFDWQALKQELVEFYRTHKWRYMQRERNEQLELLSRIASLIGSSWLELTQNPDFISNWKGEMIEASCNGGPNWPTLFLDAIDLKILDPEIGLSFVFSNRTPAALEELLIIYGRMDYWLSLQASIRLLWPQTFDASRVDWSEIHHFLNELQDSDQPYVTLLSSLADARVISADNIDVNQGGLIVHLSESDASLTNNFPSILNF